MTWNFTFWGLRRTEGGYVAYKAVTLYDGMVEWVR